MDTLILGPTLSPTSPFPSTVLQHARRIHFEGVFTCGISHRSASLCQQIPQPEGPHGQILPFLFMPYLINDSRF